MGASIEINFRVWRLGLGWTQRQAALELGYSRKMIQLYDEGKKSPPLVLILAMENLSNRHENPTSSVRSAA